MMLLPLRSILILLSSLTAKAEVVISPSKSLRARYQELRFRVAQHVPITVKQILVHIVTIVDLESILPQAVIRKWARMVSQIWETCKGYIQQGEGVAPTSRRYCISVQGARLQNIVPKVVNGHIGESMLPCAIQFQLEKMSQERIWKLFLLAT